MSCECGGACCGQPKGLGFLWWSGESGGGADDFWGFGDSFWSDGGDFWGFNNPYWDGYFNPMTNTFYFYDSDSFLPSNTSSSDWNWQGLVDWWAELTGGGRQTPQPNTPPLLPYCPGGTYHPIHDPYSCVPFPPETPEFEKQQRAAAAHKAAQDALRAAQRGQQQQTAQGCPPNTGLVKNPQGQCVCPPGYAPNAQLRKCVLVNASLAAQGNQAPNWLKWAILAGVVVLAIKR